MINKLSDEDRRDLIGYAIAMAICLPLALFVLCVWETLDPGDEPPTLGDLIDVAAEVLTDD